MCALARAAVLGLSSRCRPPQRHLSTHEAALDARGIHAYRLSRGPQLGPQSRPQLGTPHALCQGACDRPRTLRRWRPEPLWSPSAVWTNSLPLCRSSSRTSARRSCSLAAVTGRSRSGLRKSMPRWSTSSGACSDARVFHPRRAGAPLRGKSRRGWRGECSNLAGRVGSRDQGHGPGREHHRVFMGLEPAIGLHNVVIPLHPPAF